MHGYYWYGHASFSGKIQEGRDYIVEPGCCCAFFNLLPEKDPHRGTISFRNKTKEKLLLIAAEANVEEVAPGETKTEYTYESAMCMFKPCSIVIAKMEYDDPKYDYHHNDGKDHKALSAEQEKHIVDGTWFHFMHGEKIIAELDKAGKITLKPDGYLKPQEYEKFFLFDK